jgi:hypothetical protein
MSEEGILKRLQWPAHHRGVPKEITAWPSLLSQRLNEGPHADAPALVVALLRFLPLDLELWQRVPEAQFAWFDQTIKESTQL